MNITRGKLPGAKKVVLYGPEGVGKSTFASRFPTPLFIDTEDGTKELDVARFDKPTTWEMLLQQVRYVLDHPDICKTLVVDTADWAEKLCIKSICDKYSKDSIAAFDYGRGYSFAHESFGKLLNLLSDVTDRGVHAVVTAHAATRRREQPEEFGTYDRWELKLLDSEKCSTAKMVKEWGDLVLFINYKTLVVTEDDKGKKYKAQGGKRVMYTTHHPCWDAKNRFGLPDELPLDYAPLAPFFEAPAANKGAPSQTAPTSEKEDAPPQAPNETPPAPSAPPASEKKPDAAPQETTGAGESDDMAIPEKLKPLLANADVTELEVREVIAKRQGCFPMGTTWKVMQESGFVDGWVIPFWDKIVKMIQDDPDRLPF